MSDESATSKDQIVFDDAKLIPYMILFLTYVLNVQKQYKGALDAQNVAATFSLLRRERLNLGLKLGFQDGGESFLNKVEQNVQVLLSFPDVATLFTDAVEDYPRDQPGCPRSMAVFDLLAGKSIPSTLPPGDTK